MVVTHLPVTRARLVAGIVGALASGVAIGLCPAAAAQSSSSGTPAAIAAEESRGNSLIETGQLQEGDDALARAVSMNARQPSSGFEASSAAICSSDTGAADPFRNHRSTRVA